jgi:hypothetical protein
VRLHLEGVQKAVKLFYDGTNYVIKNPQYSKKWNNGATKGLYNLPQWKTVNEANSYLTQNHAVEAVQVSGNKYTILTEHGIPRVYGLQQTTIY